MNRALSPQEAWEHMVEGNTRFLRGDPSHPNQDATRRSQTAIAQRPLAALFGCSDSRLSAEIIFDQGLGDLFVVRNIGQVISPSVIGSLEFAAEVLEVPLLVVLAHDSCGAVKAAIDVTLPGAAALPPHIQTVIDQIEPAVRRVRESSGLSLGDEVDAESVGREHLRDTISELLTASELIGQRIADGRLAIVGANYQLHDGLVQADVIVGKIDHPAS